jgi:hypothetical protein
MKTTNALVTYTDLTTMGLVAKGTPATGSRIATKSFINSNYYVNQSASPYNTYTSLRCPPYQTIEAGFTNSGTLYYSSVSTEPVFYTGFSTRAAACAHSTGGSVTVYWSGSFGNGTVLYLDADGIDQFDGSGYFSLGGYSFETDVATVFSYLVCGASTAAVDIYNNTAGTNITNITINGVQVDGAVFPIVAGDGASATTTQIGLSLTIVVSYTNVSNDSVEVIDTASNLTCISATSTSRTFSGQVVSASGTVTVSMFDGSCP